MPGPLRGVRLPGAPVPRRGLRAHDRRGDGLRPAGGGARQGRRARLHRRRHGAARARAPGDAARDPRRPWEMDRDPVVHEVDPADLAATMRASTRTTPTPPPSARAPRRRSAPGTPGTARPRWSWSASPPSPGAPPRLAGVTLVWRGPLTDPSGWAAEGRAMVRGLREEGADLRRRPPRLALPRGRHAGRARGPGRPDGPRAGAGRRVDRARPRAAARPLRPRGAARSAAPPSPRSTVPRDWVVRAEPIGRDVGVQLHGGRRR